MNLKMSLGMSSITLSDFARILGKTPSSVQGNNGKAWHKYITKGEGKERPFVTKESLNQYYKDKELDEELIAKCGLFIEYLNKELDIKYQDIGKFVSKYSSYAEGTISVSCGYLRLSVKMDLAILASYKKYDSEKIRLFDEYYGWVTK